MNALRSRRELTSETSIFDTNAKGYNVILSEAKNLGPFRLYPMDTHRTLAVVPSRHSDRATVGSFAR
jgi:hypothetical protein